MEIKRFFVDRENIRAGKIQICGQEFYHATKVLRLKAGYLIVAACGDGFDYFGKIDEIGKDFLTATVLEVKENLTELSFELIYLQAIPSRDKLEVLVQKTQELGVKIFQPFISENVNQKDINLARLTQISKEAAKQCGAAQIMQINPVIGFKNAVQLAKSADLAFFCYEGGVGKRLLNHTKQFENVKSIAVMIGSEGGFEKGEVETVLDAGLEVVTLGSRVLRSETAGIVASALVIEGYEVANG